MLIKRSGRERECAGVLIHHALPVRNFGRGCQILRRWLPVPRIQRKDRTGRHDKRIGIRASGEKPDGDDDQ
ncbi:hypothetical protein Aam_331_014 [Acidocella aminolytica 101 = DSM 11237]|uniref:Uncharacterized protein n=1 Tax=Acidocella aminolytica 101 = DSM 11237 TaxID=1120923 RepID=A0A0D6PNC2_9PROT|nr:hypothetical protein Aam_331_014 [Acidocella aminolytica 101 = DSM 11237]GBQ42456.1 hypothetical protein AA11237_2974 [Acidocella aminolytica 101 = DSM 11237]